MKNIIIIVLLVVCNLGFSQVIIGDNVGTATDKRSVLLEFAYDSNEGKGIIIPYVTSLPSGAGLQGGTFVLDATNKTKAKVKVWDGSTWIDLSSGNEADITSFWNEQSTQTENSNAKVIIGANSTTASGILVLESPNKAMVLPMVDSTNTVLSPAPGTMVYVNHPGPPAVKRLAVFNGTGWTFWEPTP